jgi:hypothetical protein
MVNKRQVLTDECEKRYQQFVEMRNKYPNIKNSNRSHYLEVIAKKLHLSHDRMYSRYYEGRWQDEQIKRIAKS